MGSRTSRGLYPCWIIEDDVMVCAPRIDQAEQIRHFLFREIGRTAAEVTKPSPVEVGNDPQFLFERVQKDQLKSSAFSVTPCHLTWAAISVSIAHMREF